MKFLLVCLIFGTLSMMVLGWTATERTDATGEYAGLCKSSNEKIGVLKSGEEKLIEGQCYKVSCGVSGDEGWITSYGCGVVGTQPPCKVVEDNTKLYPECCPKAVCPHAD